MAAGAAATIGSALTKRRPLLGTEVAELKRVREEVGRSGRREPHQTASAMSVLLRTCDEGTEDWRGDSVLKRRRQQRLQTRVRCALCLLRFQISMDFHWREPALFRPGVSQQASDGRWTAVHRRAKPYIAPHRKTESATPMKTPPHGGLSRVLSPNSTAAFRSPRNQKAEPSYFLNSTRPLQNTSYAKWSFSFHLTNSGGCSG